MKRKLKIDLVTACVLIAVVLLYYSQTFSIRQTALISISSSFIPRLCVIVVLILSGIILVRSIVGLRNLNAKDGVGDEDSVTSQSEDKRELIAALVAFLLIFIGTLLIGKVGFVFGSFTYLLLSFITLGWFLEKKNWILSIALAVVSPVTIFIIFYFGFHLGLPNGILGILGGIL